MRSILAVSDSGMTEDIFCEVIKMNENKINKQKLELMDKITSKSKLTTKDVEEISNKIKRGIAKRHGLSR